MKNRKYLKDKISKQEECNTSPEQKLCTSLLIANLTKRKIYIIITAFLCLCIPLCGSKIIGKFIHAPEIVEETETKMISLPVAATTNGMSTIAIPVGTVKANPFLPYKEISTKTIDVPSTTLVEPPYSAEGDSDAIRVMDTIVSGILYDKYSPSAIINIGGVDYLVKKGDVVNNYKVLNIMKDTVTVKLGANVYEAGIGEILTSGEVNANTVSNLNKKFGGTK